MSGDERADYLFVLLSANAPVDSSSRHCLHNVEAVEIGRGARSWHGDGPKMHLMLPDPWMSARHACLQNDRGQWVLVDRDSSNGTLMGGARIRERQLRDGDVFELGHTFFLFRESLPVAGSPAPPHPDLVTLSPALEEQFRSVLRLAGSAASLLIQGETGTGKEVLARALHTLSKRSGPFVAVNCGAIAPALVESELFGYKKGAFSGAVEDRPGLIRSADGGTLFLDEIGELPNEVQVKFLRVLQESEVLPVGASRPVAVDLRICSATHRPLETLMLQGEFRPDLFARISGFTLELPPLRKRMEDFGLLTATFIRRHSATADRISISNAALRALLAHRWPLNIRELEKCVETALALTDSRRIRLQDLPPGLRERPHEISMPMHGAPDVVALLPDDRRQMLLELLAIHRGNVSAVARAMNKAPVQVRRWCRQYGVDLQAFRPARPSPRIG